VSDRTRPEAGSASLELALMAPVLMVSMLFVVFLGRVAEARADVDRAARDAARAASIARFADAARESGALAARATLADARVACSDLRVDVDVAQFVPGGAVRATVTCMLALDDLSLLRLPGSRTVTAMFAEPIDAFRGIGQ
jgi:Flp pilus assembly protein TadG